MYTNKDVDVYIENGECWEMTWLRDMRAITAVYVPGSYPWFSIITWTKAEFEAALESNLKDGWTVVVDTR